MLTKSPRGVGSPTRCATDALTQFSRLLGIDFATERGVVNVCVHDVGEFVAVKEHALAVAVGRRPDGQRPPDRHRPRRVRRDYLLGVERSAP